MSHFDCEIIRTKSKSLALLWQIGDKLYYVSFLGALLIVCANSISKIFTRLKGSYVGPDILKEAGLYGLLFFTAVTFLAFFLKNYAGRKAGVKTK
jgi:hypothetical protein